MRKQHRTYKQHSSTREGSRTSSGSSHKTSSSSSGSVRWLINFNFRSIYAGVVRAFLWAFSTFLSALRCLLAVSFSSRLWCTLLLLSCCTMMNFCMSCWWESSCSANNCNVINEKTNNCNVLLMLNHNDVNAEP